jgi:hypothetical protein
LPDESTTQNAAQFQRHILAIRGAPAHYGI